MDLKLLFITLLFTIILNVECAKILGIFHFLSESHHTLGSTLLKALAKRGHQVTMLSPFPLDTPLENYEDIELTSMLELKTDSNFVKLIQGHNLSIFEKLSSTRIMVEKVNKHFLTHPSVKNLIESKRKFDAVIQDYMGNDAYFALPYLLEASSIAFSTVGSNAMLNQATGNSAPYSYVPNIFPSLPEEMTFFQRVTNTLAVILLEIFYNLFMIPEQNKLLHKYFPGTPSVQELMKNISLVLLNSHYSIESPRPYVPNMIQVGGLHVEEPKELKGDLKEFMDSANEGVIFFSLGSNINASELPQDKLDAIIQTFSKLSMKVLWKFETENVLNLPSNVKIGKWLPQRDILAHANTKLFVTHGGLLSVTEAIYHGVPMVGIPFFADQERNMDSGVANGYAVKMPFRELSEERLTAAMYEVLSNPKYRRIVRQRSSVLKDQPLKPIDKAVFWVEYVIRHKGANHLKTSAANLKWYQYYLLDVVCLIFLIIFSLIGIFYLVIRVVLKLLQKIFVQTESSGKIQKSRKTKLS